MGIQDEALKLHEEWQGKLSIDSKVPVKNKHDLSMAYTPGVAEPCRMIHKNKEDVYKYTGKGNMVAVVTDGSAVLGLGDIGPEAALPVMERGRLFCSKNSAVSMRFRSVFHPRMWKSSSRRSR